MHGTPFCTHRVYMHMDIFNMTMTVKCNELGERPAPAVFRRDRRRLIRFPQEQQTHSGDGI